MDWKLKLWLKMVEKEQRDKTFARSQVAYALKTGKLKKDTCVCGSTKVEAHHPDYGRPLDVIWACRKHHAELDKMKRDEEAAIEESLTQLYTEISTKNT